MQNCGRLNLRDFLLKNSKVTQGIFAFNLPQNRFGSATDQHNSSDLCLI